MPSCIRVCDHGMLRVMLAAVTSEDLSIEYETFGVAGDPPVLLVNGLMGFGAQLGRLAAGLL